MSQSPKSQTRKPHIHHSNAIEIPRTTTCPKSQVPKPLLIPLVSFSKCLSQKSQCLKLFRPPSPFQNSVPDTAGELYLSHARRAIIWWGGSRNVVARVAVWSWGPLCCEASPKALARLYDPFLNSLTVVVPKVASIPYQLCRMIHNMHICLD